MSPPTHTGSGAQVVPNSHLIVHLDLDLDIPPPLVAEPVVELLTYKYADIDIDRARGVATWYIDI